MLILAKSSEFKFGTTNMKHRCKLDLAETLQYNVCDPCRNMEPHSAARRDLC